jgi:uncharacterized protein (DUF1330 family)
VTVAVYVIALIDVEDRAAYAAYQRHGLPTVGAAGGRVIAGGVGVTLEGEDLPSSSAIVEFPTMDAAVAWYQSELYQSTIPMRLGAAKTVSITVLPGVAPG